MYVRGANVLIDVEGRNYLITDYIQKNDLILQSFASILD
jgi:hypothetical protein